MVSGLEKVTITAYKSVKFGQENEISSGKFTVLVNPEGYSRSYKIKYKDQQASGTKARQMKFEMVEPEDIEFEFLFDKTGALPGTFKATDSAGIADEGKQGVWPDIEQFKKVVYDYKGEIHQPPYLIIQWGELIFKCVLREMSIHFKLFRADGTPIRATAKAKFTSTVENELRVRTQKDKSPDITHSRIVKSGDTLPMLCYQVYGEAGYYIQVAKANNIVNFRNIETGTKLFFPPIVKS